MRILKGGALISFVLLSGFTNAGDWNLYLLCSGTATNKANQSYKASIEFAMDTNANQAKVERSTVFREGLDISFEATPRSYFLSRSSLRDSTEITIDRTTGKLTGKIEDLAADTPNWKFNMQCERRILEELPRPKF